MSHPVLFPKTTFFYPIGNTPPVCFTQDLPLEESSSILLLGCGDPRSILNTIFAGPKPASSSRVLDFTCCDFQPAVLARNALLFTLIVDDCPKDLIWNIFYHIKVDEPSLLVLISQCQKLAEMSQDLETWSGCSYSKFLRVCSRHTLKQLNHYWGLYAEAQDKVKNSSPSLFRAFTREYDKRMPDKNTTLTSVSRAAGDFWVDAYKALSTNYHHYWTTGTVYPISHNNPAPFLVNPTFIFSLTGEGCAVHYGTYPLQSFHLASAFAGASSNASKNKGSSKQCITIATLIATARSEFDQWCNSFATAVSSSSPERVIIRFFAGDALAFSQTMHHHHITSSLSASLFVSAFKDNEIILDGGDYGPTGLQHKAPISFGVIDTSNIADHVGLMNLMICTAPLLGHLPSSTIYTESLLVDGKDAATVFSRRLCSEISTLSLLLGVAPAAYISGFTTHSNGHEISMLYAISADNRRYNERISWKIPYLCDQNVIRALGEDMLRSSWEPFELGNVLFDIYYRMFVDEDISQLLKQRKLADSIIHYHRGTFAALLGLVKSRVITDWEAVMHRVFDLLHSDTRLIMGSNNYQELCCQLHIRNIYSVETMRPAFLSLIPKKSMGRFSGWYQVPPIVCVVLIVPRQSLKCLEEMPPNSPMLQCEIRGPGYHNIFSSIQISFGKFTTQGSGSEIRAMFTEDPLGWLGSSPLMVSFWIPSHIITIEPAQTQIGLGVHPTPDTSMFLAHKLGLELSLFRANLMDHRTVHIFSQRPNHDNELSVRRTMSQPLLPQVSHESRAISATDSVVAKHTKLDGLLGAPVNHVQISPCTIKVTIGKTEKLFFYPFPINGRRSTLRIARTSGWIEIKAPLSLRVDTNDIRMINSPLLISSKGSYTVWNVHRLVLEQSPSLFSYLKVNMHTSWAFSDRERQMRSSQPNNSTLNVADTLLQIKDSFHTLFAGFSERKNRIFALAALTDGCYKPFVQIFVDQLRLDLASNTLIADACILPLSPARLQHFKRHLIELETHTTPTMVIKTSDAEAQAWMQLLPSLVERCRTWSHGSKCEYVDVGTIPVSTAFPLSPICSCGEGKNVKSFSQVPKLKKLAPFVTRAAISPLFAVSFIESVGGALKNITKGGGESQKDAPDTPLCTRCGEKEAGKRKLSKCSGCHKVSYCGKTCQRADWKSHKRNCNREL